jgi:predicted membrane-bound spermidine synthase
VYAFCQVAIGLYWAATPWLFSAIRRLYLAIATGLDPAGLVLVAALAGLILLLPTTLTGMALPVLGKQLAKGGDLGRSIGLLYGAGALGAAAGAWLTGYLVFSFLGVTGASWLAVLASLLVGFIALRLSLKVARHGADEADAAPPPSGFIALIALAIGGLVTSSLASTEIHLLAIVAGSSSQALAGMLASLFVGLGLGAWLAHRWLRHRAATFVQLAVIELWLAAAIVAGLRGWERIPAYFATFAGYPLTQSFGPRELVRIVVFAMMMIPPALSMGALFPVASDLLNGVRGNPARAIGRASVLHGIGLISGLVAAFLLLPRLGSLRTLELLAAAAIGTALVSLARLRGAERWWVAGGSVVVLALFLRLPKTFDYDKLSAGAHVYFAPSPHGEVIANAESIGGGLTTVNETRTIEGGRVLSLLTNGYFQGDDSGERMAEEQAYALYPLLHTSARNDALLIGLGTGVSAATLRSAGFAHLDIAEPSVDVAHLGDAYFADATGQILRQRGVDLHIDDGRGFLLLSKQLYDLVSIEVRHIAVAGAGSLYNRELYELAKARLSPEGVLQQSVQLHRIGVEDIVSILGTLRSEFERVWLYSVGSQGIIVACPRDCEPSAATLTAIENAPDLVGALSTLGGSVSGGASRLVADRVLSPDAVDRFLAAFASRGVAVDQLVSTDDNVFLEYHTPQGSVLDYETSLRSNVALMKSFSPSSLTEGTPPSRAR